MELSGLGSIIITTFISALFHPLFWIVCILVFVQYSRISRVEKKLFGRPFNNVWLQVAISLALGAGGGLLASVLLVVLGLSLNSIGIMFLWLVAILLLLIHPRFLCFAYAGGIVAVAVLFTRGLAFFIPWIGEVFLFSELVDIHLPGLLVLIAVLHLTESLLIFIGGHWGSSPVYLKKEGGEVIGGFTLQKFWPVPLVGMIAFLQSEAPSFVTEGVSMPDWWPILKPALDSAVSGEIFYLLLPVVAGLGYADLALSSTPRKKSYMSARYLFYYSVVLLVLALASEFYPLFIIPGVLFAPLGHELVVSLGSRVELNGRPFYRHPSGPGVMVLSVFPGSTAQKAGLREGDIIRKVNRQDVENAKHFQLLIKESYFMAYLNVERERRMLSLVLRMKHSDRLPATATGMSSAHGRQPLLGLILVPDEQTPAYMEIKQQSPVQRIKKFFVREK